MNLMSFPTIASVLACFTNGCLTTPGFTMAGINGKL